MKRRFSGILFCFVLAAPVTALPQEFRGPEHAYALLLLSQSDFEVRLGAKSIYRLGSVGPAVGDLLAEVTWTMCSGTRKTDVDTLSWLVKALGNTKQPRFSGLLDYCLSTVSHEKTKKYIQQARENLVGETTNVFGGGKMNLRQIRDRLLEQGRLHPRDQAAIKFADLRNGQKLQEIHSILGPPNHVSAINVPRNKVGHLYVKVRTSMDMLVLGYDGLGTIRFAYLDDQTDWTVDEAKSDAGLFWSRWDGRFFTINDLIARGGGLQLREVARHLLQQNSLQRDVLDRVAERIYRSQQEQDRQLVDGLGWLCKVIMKLGDGRYRQVLLDVAKTATSKKLQDYAREAALGLSETSEEKYVP